MFEDIKPADPIGAICERIESLTHLEQPALKEQKLKEEYSSMFEPIPHIDLLPTDVLAEIHIKDPSKMICNHSYPSPQKYKDTWQVPIQQHLDTGHIHPLSSSYASPLHCI
jgi:hypothetical protein